MSEGTSPNHPNSFRETEEHKKIINAQKKLQVGKELSEILNKMSQPDQMVRTYMQLPPEDKQVIDRYVTNYSDDGDAPLYKVLKILKAAAEAKKDLSEKEKKELSTAIAGLRKKQSESSAQ